MTEARHRSFWRRTAPIAAFGALLVAGVAQGCSDSTPDNPTTSGPGPTSSSGMGGATSSSTGSAGGGGSTGSSLCVDQSANGMEFSHPFDSTPDGSGQTIYFTAFDPNMVPGEMTAGVFSVPFDGSQKPTALVVGAPLESPIGIAIDTGGKTLYVADPGAEVDAAKPRGAIFTVPVAGGAATPIVATEDYRPRNLEIAQENGADVLYFTGTDPADQTVHGVFSMPAAGGAVTKVVGGFVDPSSIAIAKTGELYVTDSLGNGGGLATVVRVKGGAASPFASDIRVNFPAGLALSLDESTLYVSGLDPLTAADVVYSINVASQAVTQAANGSGCSDLSKNFEAAGIHRAKNNDVFSWADSTAGLTGAVYRVTFK